MYSLTTNNIKISVESFYLDEESEPDENLYIWGYHVKIENNGNKSIKLCRRHWEITDSLGRSQTVDGTGVVGETPIIPPGKSYEYTSGTPLVTPSGIMMGDYSMSTLEGAKFKVKVPAFSLDSPYEQKRYH